MPATVAHHNRVVRAGTRRALALEPKLAAVLLPILDRASRDAAKAFAARATSLTAATGTTRSLQDAFDAVDEANRRLGAAIHIGNEREIQSARKELDAARKNLDRTLAAEGAKKTKKKKAPGEQPVASEIETETTPQSPEAVAQGTPGGRESVQVGRQVVERGAEETRIEDQVASEIEAISQSHGADVAQGLKEALTKPFGGEPDWAGPVADEIVNLTFLIDQLRTKTDPVREAVVESVMKSAVEGVGIEFDLTNPFAARVLAQSGSQITNIAATTQLNVMRIIGASHDQGLSIPDTAKAIRVGMKEANQARATLIARTELAGAVNGGSLAATQIVQSATGETLYKQWLTAPGARYPRHEDYDGLDEQTQVLDGYFDVGGNALQFPGDPDGPPEDVCNCRCALVYVGADEAAQQGIQLGGQSSPPAPLEPPEIARPLMAPPPEEAPTVTTDDPTVAAQALWDGQKVVLNQPTEIATLIDDLGAMAKDAQEKGIAAPPLDLGKVTVPGTNLFTQDSIGAPRVEMPQLKGVPVPGSLADAMARDERGEVDIAPLFYKHLRDEGVKIEPNQSVRVDHLRATQTELDGAKVAGIMDYLEGGGKIEGSIPVTKDGYVIDGHHRWAAEIGLDYKTDADKPWMIQADVVDKDVTSIINEANIFAAEYGIPQSSAFVKTLDAAKETTVGITPFREGDEAVNFYETAKARQFEAELDPVAKQYGVTVSRSEKVAGVWKGEQEPSYSVTAHDGPDGVAKFAATMRAKYDQDGVMLFTPDPVGEGYSYTLHRVDPNEVIPKLGDYGIDGATATADTVTIVGDQALADDVARLAGSVKSVVTVKRGTLSFVERGEVPRSTQEISALHPGVEMALSEHDRGVVVSMIRVPVDTQGKGAAASAMTDVLRYADRNGLVVALTPEAVSGGMSTTQLRAWYKRLGFVPNKGRSIDLRFTESMIRAPVAGARPDWDPYGLTVNSLIERATAMVTDLKKEGAPAEVVAGLETQKEYLVELRAHPDPVADLSAARAEQLGLVAKVDGGTATAVEKARSAKLADEIKRLELLTKSDSYKALAQARQAAADRAKQAEIAERQEKTLREAVAKGEQLKADQVSSLYLMRDALADKADNAFVEIPPRTIHWSANGDYHVERGVAWRHDGVVYTAEMPTPAFYATGPTEATVGTIQKKIEPWIDALPPEIRGRLDRVNVFTGTDPDEAYWTKQYGEDGGHILASTGMGEMSFWNSLTQPEALTQATVEHESGHLLFLGGGGSDPQAWVDAANKDARRNHRLYKLGPVGTDGGYLEGKTPGSFRGFLVGVRGVSDYGGTDPAEDWAESVRLFLLDRRDGNIGTLKLPDGTEKTVTFADVYPNRAKLVSEWLALAPPQPAKVSG